MTRLRRWFGLLLCSAASLLHLAAMPLGPHGDLRVEHVVAAPSATPVVRVASLAEDSLHETTLSAKPFSGAMDSGLPYGATRSSLPVFFLGLLLAACTFLLVGWRVYAEPCHLALAALSGGAIVHVALATPLVPLSVSPVWLAPFLILTAAFALHTFFPGLFGDRQPDHRAPGSAFSPPRPRLVESIPPWLRRTYAALLFSILVVALLVLPIFLAAELFVWNWGLAPAIYFLLLLVLLPVATMMVVALRARRLVLLGGLSALAVSLTVIVCAHAVGTTSVLFSYVFYAVLVGVGAEQIHRTVKHHAQQLRDSRQRIKHLLDTDKERTDQLNDLMLKAQAASVAKTQFVSAVSHELRTPLSAIRGYAQILQEELTGAIEPFHEESLRTIEQSCDRLTALVNDLLDMAKVESGRIDLTLTTVYLRPLIEEVTKQLFPLAEAKDLILLRPSFVDENPFVHADTLRLRQVLINLISNAIKFTETGCVGVRVAPSTMANYNKTLHAEPAYAIEVFDTGIGISSEFIDRVFEPFTQEDRAYSNAQCGTGLGLSITREFVERMGGTITVESVPDQGTTFTVLLAKEVGTGGEDKGPEGTALFPGGADDHVFSRALP